MDWCVKFLGYTYNAPVVERIDKINKKKQAVSVKLSLDQLVIETLGVASVRTFVHSYATLFLGNRSLLFSELKYNQILLEKSPTDTYEFN